MTTLGRWSQMQGFADKLADTCATGGCAVISEIKVKAADGTDLLKGREVAELVAAYEAGGATCLSVVTGKWFGGTPALLGETVRASRLPVLVKDFFRSPADVARVHAEGARAVLVTLKVLAPVAVDAVFGAARDLGIDAFVECSSAAERDQALRLGAKLIAINNRDITLRETDGAGVERSLAVGVGGGERAIWVSASGIETGADAEALARNGFDAMLVGTALLRDGDPRLNVQGLVTAALRGASHRRRGPPQLKVCGISQEAELELLGERGVAWAGLCVFPGQRYSLSLDRARVLSAAARGVRPVLVTVSRDADQISREIDAVEPAGLQLSGFTRPQHVAQLRQRYSRSQLQISQVLHYRGAAPVESGPERYVEAGASALLADSTAPGLAGSTGIPLEPSALDALGAMVAAPLWIAGGLTAATVVDSARRSRADGVDVLSGVHGADGVDAARLDQLQAALRGVW